MEADPGVGGAGHSDLDLRVGLHILVHVFLIVGAEPQLALLLEQEHEGTALGLAVTAHGGQILHRVFLQKFNDFFHDEYLHIGSKFGVSRDFSSVSLSYQGCFRPTSTHNIVA